MEDTAHRAIAIVAAGAILPDAPNVSTFWNNIKNGRYSISEVRPERWNPDLYYDPDHAAPDKTYSKIGGWVREAPWDPMGWRLPIPPRVAAAMDGTQQWAIACTRAALEDYGYPKRPFDPDRTAVILGNAMAGERHYLTSMRVFFPEYARELAETAGFAALPENIRRDVTEELHRRMGQLLPEITEDSMPGELSNCIAGRVANLFNFHGPNFVCDAACASAMAAISAAIEGLVQGDFDVAVSGGIDRNMGAPTFVKFCKIGALSGSGTRPYAEGADGFVMGEGAAVFLLKRLADAERDGDKVYAVLRGMGGASDGRGKGITAPNPVGQKLCVERAWKNARLSPATATYIEGHGTSTRVGDVVEVNSMAEVFQSAGASPKSVALGSVKSNIGHLKGAAGAAGLLKAALALHEKMLPPSLNFKRPNPDIDFAHSPLYVNAELRPWDVPDGQPRRAGLSAFGFGGTNFHAVLEEYIPGRLNGNGKHSIAVGELPSTASTGVVMANPQQSAPSAQATAVVETAGAPQASSIAQPSAPAKQTTPSAVKTEATPSRKAPLRGALVIGADSVAALTEGLRSVQQAAAAGNAPTPAAPAETDLRAPERIAVDYADAADLATKCATALKAFAANQPGFWKALRAQGIFRGHGPAPKVAFLYTGQGSQYVNMLRTIRDQEPIVAETFAEADGIMTPLIGKPLTEFMFADPANPDAVAKAEDDLRQTAITQPAVITINIATTRLLAAYGIRPDMTMGHSVGEYGALVAAGAMPFEDALEAVSARGREMTRVSMKDNGKMAAVFAPIAEVERILQSVDGYVVIANVNSNTQSVIGGGSQAVIDATQAFLKAGFNVVDLPVSHGFHTSIVAPASEPLRQMLTRLRLQSPQLPIIANINGEFYPTGPDMASTIAGILAQQVAAPVQFVKGLKTLYDAGARVFVEVGPKKALQGFAEDVLGSDPEVFSLFTNHPKLDDVTAFNQALCGMYAAGLGGAAADKAIAETRTTAVTAQPAPVAPQSLTTDRYLELGHLMADVLKRAGKIYGDPSGSTPLEPLAITGAALGLPGTPHIFDDGNITRILRGDQFITQIPPEFRQAMLEKRITRLLKREEGEPTFETITDVADVIKLAGRGGAFDLESEFGVPAEHLAALDRVTRLAIACGIDALRDAGIPLVMRYKTTTKGTQLPDRWGLPDAMRDDTGVIMGSAFPGYDSYAEIMSKYFADHARREELARLEDWCSRASNGHSVLGQELHHRIDELRAAIDKEPYVFERRFLLRVLSMGHSQFAELIGARGPNTQINAACATTAQAVGLAEDWIRAGRCRRVIVISADDVTSDNMIGWFGPGFLASGAAATDEAVEDAAIPFDRRRHGLIMGMGAASLVVESAEAARERGIQPICEVLSAVTANSAFHGTRLDVHHIGLIMEKLVAQAESRAGIHRQQVAPQMVFVSHETYTPARGGSASAEVHALRHVFGDAADQIVIANTKGYTGHAMATGIEDVLAVKTLETGLVPPVANFKEVDPELGPLNLSKGGKYPVEYALHLGAGFGSQIAMLLLRWVPTKDRVRPQPNALGYAYRVADPNAWNAWLARVAGKPVTKLEVVKRTLRVPDQGFTARVVETVVTSQAKPAPKPIIPAAVPPATAATTRVAAASTLNIPIPAMPPPPPLPAIEPKPATAATVAIAQPKPETAKPAPAPATAATPGTAPKGDTVKERVLSLVAEKTGYPIEMLDLDLDMEADLGVDTVKQAEVFASIREAYGIARDESIKLRDYPTLGHVINFVYSKRPDLAGGTAATATTASPIPTPPVVVPVAAAISSPLETPAPAAAAAVIATQAPTDDEIKQKVLEIVAEKTGYPQEMLDLDLDLEADLGIDTVKQAEMFASVRAAYNIPRDDMKLRDFPTLAHVIQFAQQRRPGAAAATTTVAAAAVQAPAVTAPAPAPVATPTSAVTPVAAPVVTPAPVAAVAAVATQAPTDEEIKQKVLAIVAEKTGYPQEMLDLDLDLEADLGIDTVKQAEMFASVRAAYNIPRDENMKLRDFPTLAHVIQFAQQRRPGAVAQATETAPPIVPVVPAPETHLQRRSLLSFDAAEHVPRRVPVPVLRPPLNLCKPTGVTLGNGSRIVIMPDEAGAATELATKLRALGAEVLVIDGAPDADTLTTTLKQWLAAGSIQGVYWLPALDDTGSLREMDLSTWREALRIRVKLLYTTMRTLFEQIAAPGTFLVSATALGGQHGYDAAGASTPLGGAVTGFTKAYKRERSDATVKAVDFAAGTNTSEIADTLIAETLRDPGAVEIGNKNELRWSVSVQEQSVADGQPGMHLDSSSVFVVTGAAGSIVSAITADLATASGGTFYLLDMVPEPDPNHPDLKRFAADKDGLKRELFARIQARGERATPALVEKELAALERAQAAQDAIDAVRAAGGTAQYFSVNLTDATAVAAAIDEVRKRSGHIDVLLHAAGVERSHFLPDKEAREFDLVFDVKSDGWFNLLRAIGDMPLGATVAFSSVAGRFGNGGQTDYSSANDLLCKITSSFRTTRPFTRGIAIDWSAWGGIGMATRGSIPKMMELAGIDMLPPEAGIPWIRRELTCGGTCGEVVVGQRLGVLLNEFEPTGGLDVEAVHAAREAQGPMVGKVTGMGLHSGLTMETTLDPAAQPFLYDHRIDGTPVLPGVMGIEAFAEAAVSVHPGWRVAEVEEVNFLAPFKFYRDEPRTLTVQAVFRPQGEALIADCRLIGRRTLPNQPQPQETTHFIARVRLTRQPPQAITDPPVKLSQEALIDAAQIYRIYFHGPAYQVLERAWWDGKHVVGELNHELPANHTPQEQPTLMAPRLIELCFQTAGLWEMGVHSRFGLPLAVEQVGRSRSPQAHQGPLYAVVTPNEEQETFDARVIDGAGNEYLHVTGYRTVALPNSVEVEPLKAMRAVTV